MEQRLNKLKTFYKKNHRLPTYQEMLTIFGLSSKNAVFRIVSKFVEDGFIQKKLGKLAPTSRFFSLPLLGLVKAGFPILAEEDKKYLTLDEYLIEDPISSFLLTVSGDSLIGLGIFEGDRQWTLKILRKDHVRQKMYLESANAKYPPFYPKEELKIHGIVKAVVRKMS